MDRRDLLGAFGAAGFGLLAAGVAEADDTEHHHHHMDKTHEDCLKACAECAKECNMMAHHCLDKLCKGEGPTAVHAHSHALAIDCAAFCTLSATMIARSSELMTHSCEACAEACRCCAEACEKAQNDAAMKACAAKCRECERSCRQMVKSMKATSGAKTSAR